MGDLHDTAPSKSHSVSISVIFQQHLALVSLPEMVSVLADASSWLPPSSFMVVSGSLYGWLFLPRWVNKDLVVPRGSFPGNLTCIFPVWFHPWQSLQLIVTTMVDFMSHHGASHMDIFHLTQLHYGIICHGVWSVFTKVSCIVSSDTSKQKVYTLTPTLESGSFLLRTCQSSLKKVSLSIQSAEFKM